LYEGYILKTALATAGPSPKSRGIDHFDQPTLPLVGLCPFDRCFRPIEATIFRSNSLHPRYAQERVCVDEAERKKQKLHWKKVLRIWFGAPHRRDKPSNACAQQPLYLNSDAAHWFRKGPNLL